MNIAHTIQISRFLSYHQKDILFYNSTGIIKYLLQPKYGAVYESMTDGRTVLGSSEVAAWRKWNVPQHLLGPNLINLHGELHLLPTPACPAAATG